MVRQVQVSVLYNAADISTDINQYLKSMNYRDAMSGQADDLQLSLEDKAGIWQNDWMPEKGAVLDVSMTTLFWKSAYDLPETLRLGLFEIDEITSSGYPSEVGIKAVSVPFNNQLRGEVHTRSWEKAELKTIANDIATAANLKLFYDTEENPVLDHCEQSEQSDLSFLLQLCNDNGLALKVNDGQIIIFDEAKYEAQEAGITIVKPGTAYPPPNQEEAENGTESEEDTMIYLPSILSYSLTSKLRDIYAACHVKYQSSDTKEVIEATFSAPGKTGPTLQVREQVGSVAEAERLAKKKLREQNKEEVTGSFSLPGCLRLVAGITVNLLGFGVYDGKYIITEASHDIGTGYTSSINVRRCLDGY